MIRTFAAINRALCRFQRREDGSSTVEFLFIFPVFLLIFLNCYEAGLLSLRHVMLERGLDLTVRAVRIGRIPDPSHQQLKEEICKRTMLIPNCLADLQLEMIREQPRAWGGGFSGPVRCVDRALDVQPAVRFTNGSNNELMLLQACVIYDPKFVEMGIGKSLGDALADNSNGGYALFATSAFVMEPFK